MDVQDRPGRARERRTAIAATLVEPTGGSRTARPPEEVLVALGERLDRFAEGLGQGERDGLRTLLEAAAAHEPLATLAATDAAAILEPHEIAILEALRAEPLPMGGSLRDSLVLIMKATRLCNLRCTYCYQWRDGPDQVMSFEVLARTTRDALRDPGVRHVEFVWHGGEATLLKTKYYRKALWLQQAFRRPGVRIENAMQTNAVRMTAEWLGFWRDYGFSIGVSLDGPAEINDRRRVDVAGRGTSARVAANLARLRDSAIDHGVLMVVDGETVAAGAARLLDWLAFLGVDQIDLLNVLPGNEDDPQTCDQRDSAFLDMGTYVRFLRDVFREWWPKRGNAVSIRELDGLVGQVGGAGAGTCVFAGNCFGGFLTIDPAGDVSACDKYDGDPGYRFGNVVEAPLTSIGASTRLREVRADNAVVVDRMRDCHWFDICHGGCPHDRYTGGRSAGAGLAPGCCGMSPLLEDITRAMAGTGAALHPVARNWLTDASRASATEYSPA